MQDCRKAVWSIPYVSVASFFPGLKQNLIAYRSSKVSDCIFENHQLWQSGFSRVYSNSCCNCSFEPETIKIGQSSHEMYSNKILNFQESTIILNAHMKKVWKLIEVTTYLLVHSSQPMTFIHFQWVTREVRIWNDSLPSLPPPSSSSSSPPPPSSSSPPLPPSSSSSPSSPPPSSLLPSSSSPPSPPPSSSSPLPPSSPSPPPSHPLYPLPL